MQILLLADTHDQHAHIRLAYAQASEKTEIDAVLHLGDLAKPATLDVLAEIDVPIYYVIGNNEDDPEEIALRCQDLGIHFLGEQGELVLDGRRCALTHYPRVAQALAGFGDFDLIGFGHSHNAMKRQLDNGGWLVNPGNLAGWREQARYAFYDTQAHTIHHYDLEVRKRHWHFA